MSVQGSAIFVSKTTCAANVHGGKACPKKTFADTLRKFLWAILRRSVPKFDTRKCLHPEKSVKGTLWLPTEVSCEITVMHISLTWQPQH
eukprot:1141015-Pelagomonas_calceolata.AAC.2